MTLFQMQAAADLIAFGHLPAGYVGFGLGAMVRRAYYVNKSPLTPAMGDNWENRPGWETNRFEYSEYHHFGPHHIGADYCLGDRLRADGDRVFDLCHRRHQ